VYAERVYMDMATAAWKMLDISQSSQVVSSHSLGEVEHAETAAYETKVRFNPKFTFYLHHVSLPRIA